MKKIIKAIIVAFSIYSKIPMPRFNWESEDMQYHLCFFPWVGAVIGGVEFLWFVSAQKLSLGNIVFISIALAIPLLITGGFHLDGYMDTCDALHSYQDREKKLEILKDPHIGAFAVICLLIYLLLAAGFLSELGEKNAVIIACMNFFLARVCSGISVVTMPSAKKKGMLQTFASTAARKIVLGTLIAEGVLCIIGMLAVNTLMGVAVIITAAVIYVYYDRMSKKQFGGITGDLAGFFVTVEELAVLIVLAVVCIVSRLI